MGFISYLEDIQKVREDLMHLASRLDALTETDVHARRRALQTQVENVAQQLDKLIELATDPQIALAEDLLALRVERQLAEKQTSELAAKVAETDALNKQLRERLRVEGREKRQAEQAFSKIASDDFARALDMFPPTAGVIKKR